MAVYIFQGRMKTADKKSDIARLFFNCLNIEHKNPTICDIFILTNQITGKRLIEKVILHSYF